MGRLLGAFDNDQELDRPDLNKCPDCDCYFSGDTCPICKKICPDNMRAGKRAPVKHKKRKRNSGSGRVVFVQWYHSWWFITIMMLLFTTVGIILLLTSPHKTWKKVLFVAIAVVYMVLSTIGIGNIVSSLTDIWDPPVDKSLTREEYIAKCESVTPEQLFRSTDGFKDKYISAELKIIKNVTYFDKYYNEKDYVCYLCEDVDGSSYKIILRDCLLEEKLRFLPGDVITVYGEGAGECKAFDHSAYTELSAPCLNMAYFNIK